jgi:hypothetical protein
LPEPICRDVTDGALLRRRQRIGQSGDDARPQTALGRAAAAGAGAHVPAQQRQRQLARQQFVIGEPRPRRAFRHDVFGRLGPVQPAQRLGKSRIGVARQPGCVLPFRQVRKPRQRRVDRLAQLVRTQPLGQRIDRVEQRQAGKSFRVDDTVGMHHLQMAVVERRGARYVPDFADRQELLQIVLARVEIGDGERIGLVARLDVVGRAGPVRRRRAVLLGGHRDGHDRIRLHLAQFRLVAAIDEAGRHMEQEIGHARRLAVAADQAREQLFELRPDARQRRQRREKRIEERRTHRIPLTFLAPLSIYPSPGRVRAFGVDPRYGI